VSYFNWVCLHIDSSMCCHDAACSWQSGFIVLLLTGLQLRFASAHRPVSDRDDKDQSIMSPDTHWSRPQVDLLELHRRDNTSLGNSVGDRLEENRQLAWAAGKHKFVAPSVEIASPMVQGSRLATSSSSSWDEGAVSGRNEQGLSATLNQGAELKEPKHGKTLLQAVACSESGWTKGLQVVADWAKQNPSRLGDLGVDEDGDSGSALSCAIKAKSAEAVRLLIFDLKASVLRRSQGLTPLEVAAEHPSTEVVKALLIGTDLEGGLARLRVQLDNVTSDLPTVMERVWSWNNMTKLSIKWTSHVKQLQSLEPAARDKLGNLPTNWILHYENQVMYRFMNNNSDPATTNLLRAQGFASFVRDMSSSVIALFMCVGFFGLYAYVIFQFRVYGGLEAPISLSHLVLGAFDPARVADPDFDPARQAATLPYKNVLPIMSNQSSLFVIPGALLHAVVGTYSSWCLQSVRIPLERDPFDEDYLEEDDDDKRKMVRDACRRNALRIRFLEVSLRFAVFLAVLWWFAQKSARSSEVCMLALVVSLFAMVAAATATSTVPAPVPELYNDCEENNADAASLTCALFSVQHGPRWTRTVSATRHSAHPARPGPGRGLENRRGHPRRRGKRPPATRLMSEKEDDAGSGGERLDVQGEVAGNAAELEPSMLPPSEAMLTAEIPERMQRQLVKGAYLHIKMDAFLPWALFNFVAVAFLMLWLTHARVMLLGTWEAFYKRVASSDIDPAEQSLKLFEIYGAPRSLQRWGAVALELLLLLTTGERLYALAGMLLAAALTLQQRQRVMEFVSEWRGGASEESGLQDLLRCIDFVLELSSFRWQVLRLPTLILYIATVMGFVGTMAIIYIQGSLHTGAKEMLENVSALVPMSISLALTTPLFLVLLSAVRANSEVARQHKWLGEQVESVHSSSASAGKDAEKQECLRLKANDILKDGLLTWPGGVSLGYKEPTLLAGVMIACAVTACCVK